MVRIEAAQAMLQRGATVAAAAAASGFGSAETMRRVFTQKIGMSPSLYLERLLSQP
jgi:transcriptional regulator GlxA family with amidase domain